MEGAGFTVEQNTSDRRLIVNRTRRLQMHRVWQQGKFRKPYSASTSALASNPALASDPAPASDPTPALEEARAPEVS